MRSTTYAETPTSSSAEFHPYAHASLIVMAAMAIGLADASLIANAVLGAAGGFQYIPPRLWLVAPLCWTAAALALAVPSYAVSRRRGAELTAIAMIALFLVVRFQTQSPSRIAVAAAAFVLGAALVWRIGPWWVASRKRMAAASMAVVSVALLAGAVGISRVDRLPPQASQAASRTGPDVVLVFLDTISYDSIFSRGTSVDPRLAFLARLASRSIVFDRAYTPAPWTLPAHFSAVTGIPAYQLGIDFDHQQYDGRGMTLARRFRRRGYRTAAVISNTFLNRGTGFARDFETFEHAGNALDICRTVPGVLLDRWSPRFAASVCNWSAGEVTRRAIAHVARDDGRPLFLLLNYMDAHDPYYVERRCDPPRGANPLALDVAPGEYRRRYYASHLAAIRCIDQSLGDLAAQLERRKRDTVLAVLSDHGEQFGEHGLVRHGNSLYDRLLHVSFMIAGPGIPPHHVAEPVSIEALPRVVMEIVDRGRAVVASGAVISSLMPPRKSGDIEQWSLIRGRWHLIRRGDTLALYDLALDPAEEKPIAMAPDNAALFQSLEQELARATRSRVDARSDNFRSLGYIH